MDEAEHQIIWAFDSLQGGEEVFRSLRMIKVGMAENVCFALVRRDDAFVERVAGVLTPPIPLWRIMAFHC